MNFGEIYLQLFEFISKGGDVMWLICLLAFALWYLILERSWYLTSGIKHDLAHELAVWQDFNLSSRLHSNFQRKALTAKLQQKIELNLSLLKTLILLCPLLGLLGTVTGMITVFDVISLHSSGDVKLMAAGISKATIPTMASMVIAISGIFALGFIRKTANTKKQTIASFFTGAGNA